MLDLEFYESSLKRMQEATVVQGKDIPSMKDSFLRDDFSLCPELWFWVYNAGNEVYPHMLTCSPTPFWTEGQAKIDLRIEKDRIERKIAALKSKKEIEK